MAIPTYKDIMDLLGKAVTIEAQEKIMELRSAAINLEDELHETKKKLRESEEKKISNKRIARLGWISVLDEQRYRSTRRTFLSKLSRR